MFNWRDQDVGRGMDRAPVFIFDPQDAFVKRGGGPAELNCRALYASKILFKCNGKQVLEKHHQHREGIHTTPRHEEIPFVETAIKVAFKHLRDPERKGLQEYACQCFAISNSTVIASDTAYVRSAFIRKDFKFVPSSERVAVGKNVAFRCEPPDGQPPPQIFWMKNGQEIKSRADPNLIIDSYQSLLINAARLTDAGNYTCGARNEAGIRHAKTVSLKVHIDGSWSQWDPWTMSACDVTCEELPLGEDGTRIPPFTSRKRYCNDPPPQYGGKTCPGPAEEKEQCGIKCPVDGKWGKWNEWSKCSANCEQWRARDCDSPLPRHGGKDCPGSAYQSRNCSTDFCAKGATSNQAIAAAATAGSNYALYGGVGAATLLVLMALAVFIAYAVSRRKGNRATGFYYASASPMSQVLTSKHPPDLAPNSLLMHEDAFKHFPDGVSSFGRPPSGGTLNSLGSDKLPRNLRQTDQLCGSKAPLLFDGIPNPCNGSGQGSHPSSIDSWPPQPRSVTSQSTSSRGGDDASAAGGYATLYDTMDYAGMMDRIKEVEQDDAVSISSACLPPDVQIEDVAFATVGPEGARLIIPDSRVVLTIPQGAIDSPKEVFVAVAKESYGPQVTDSDTLVSPVVFIGPPELRVSKAVVLSVPHSAQLLPVNNWNIQVHANDCATSQPYRFQHIATIGQENINTPVYCQLDMDTCHIVTDLHPHTQFALVGRAASPRAPVAKRMRLAVFAPTTTTQHECSLRVYCLDAAHSPLHSVLREEAGGARLVLEPKDLLFQEGGPLCLSLSMDESTPWAVSRAGTAYQEIPSGHVWNLSHQLHCAFALERTSPSNTPLTARLVVYQKFPDGTHSQRTHLLVTVPSNNTKPAVNLMPLAQRPLDAAFRLDAATKAALCALLDPPAEHNDWRTLAQKLCVDRYVNFFATRESPTWVILDLWEARDRDSTAVADLAQILRSMQRHDAAALLRSS